MWVALRRIQLVVHALEDKVWERILDTEALRLGRWELAIKQLQVRLALAQVKTADVLQRAQVASAIILPKLTFVGRYAWPSASRLRDLQRRLHNYVWHGRFVAEWPGRTWMSEDTAALSRKEGGIGVPDLTAAFIQLAASTYIRWSARGQGICSAIGAILSASSVGRLEPAPARTAPLAPRLHSTLAGTGKAWTSAMTTQPRSSREHELTKALLQLVGRGTSRTRWWGGQWYFADYTADHHRLIQLRQLQTDAHGSFDFHALMQARVCGDSVLFDATGQPVRPSDFPHLVRANDTIGDLVDIQWWRRFRRLCDTLIYNYPSALAPHDPEDVVRVSTATIDSWRLVRTGDSGFSLTWEPSAGITIDLGQVATPRDITAKVRQALDCPTARAHDHGWLGPLRSIWRPTYAPLTKGRIKHHVRAPKTTRGRREVSARARRLLEQDADIGAAMAALSWSAIDQLQGTTSSQRLRLRRIKSDRVSGWDRLHGRYGCPHCPDAPDGGSVSHIFWRCPAAQTLRTTLRNGWEGYGIWTDKEPVTDQLKRAAFGLRIPRVPSSIWRLPDVAAIDAADTSAVDSIHQAVQVAWQQQVLEVLHLIWRWRHNIEHDEQQWSSTRATQNLIGTLRSSLRGLLDRLPRRCTLRDPRRQLLSALADGYDGVANAHSVPTPVGDQARHILFFDGGSRGNPGPGGAGAVLVSTDQDGLNPRVDWSACMSYAANDMTNNQAEYLGAIAGAPRGFAARLATYCPPRHVALRPLYSTARRLADIVGVDVWQHHLRAYNKMADAAANVAKDTKASVQVSHPSDRPHTLAIEAFLSSDYDAWHTSQFLRAAQDPL